MRLAIGVLLCAVVFAPGCFAIGGVIGSSVAVHHNAAHTAARLCGVPGDGEPMSVAGSTLAGVVLGAVLDGLVIYKISQIELPDISGAGAARGGYWSPD